MTTSQHVGVTTPKFLHSLQIYHEEVFWEQHWAVYSSWRRYILICDPYVMCAPTAMVASARCCAMYLATGRTIWT
jgi:hypothetical protein